MYHPPNLQDKFKSYYFTNIPTDDVRDKKDKGIEGLIDFGGKKINEKYLEAIEKLMKLNADQGRLGGLIKMWLTNDERLMMFEQESLSKAIFSTLEMIKELQTELLEIIKLRKVLAAKKRI